MNRGDQTAAGVLGIREVLGYGAGDLANNLAFMLASMFLLIYYTDVVGISAGAAGTLFLVVRVWDAVSDLIAGRIVDRTSSRWGRYRPFLIFAGFPLLLSTVAVFWVPSGLDGGGALAYAYISFAVYGFAYSLVNIPYGSLAAVMTQQSNDRSRLSSSRTVGASLATLMLAIVVTPQIDSVNLQRSLTITVAALVVVGMALYIVTFVTVRERVQRDVEKVTLRQTWETLKRNKPLLTLTLSTVMLLVAMFALQTVAIYYARDVLGNANYYILLTVVQTAGMLGAALLVPWLVRTMSKRGAYIVGGILTGAGAAGVAVAPASVPAVAIVCFGLIGVGLGVTNTLIWAISADTVEYGEWKTGVRTEGATYSVLSFTRKVGQGIGAALAAYVIGLGGYVADAATQTDSAITAIRVAAGAVPTMFVVLAVLLMAPYSLTEAKFRDIVVDIAQRRAARQDHASVGGRPFG